MLILYVSVNFTILSSFVTSDSAVISVGHCLCQCMLYFLVCLEMLYCELLVSLSSSHLGFHKVWNEGENL